MRQRARPPEDISPTEFFTRWIGAAVAGDPARQAKLGDTRASIEFELTGGNPEPAGVYTVAIEPGGVVRGSAGAVEKPDLRVRVDVDTWRALNRGDISAPEALLRRRVHLSGSFLLALKLHLILG